MSKYEYLKQYVDFGRRSNKRPCNWFSNVPESKIIENEDRIGYSFPIALKEFWIEIGSGLLTVSYDCVEVKDYVNRILPPWEIAEIILGEEDARITWDYREDFVHEGDIPFFEIGDSSDFLFMKRDSEISDTVYDAIGGVVEKHFEDFIRKLYFESPAYYLWIGEEDKDPYRVKK